MQHRAANFGLRSPHRITAYRSFRVYLTFLAKLVGSDRLVASPRLAASSVLVPRAVAARSMPPSSASPHRYGCLRDVVAGSYVCAEAAQCVYSVAETATEGKEPEAHRFAVREEGRKEQRKAACHSATWATAFAGCRARRTSHVIYYFCRSRAHLRYMANSLKDRKKKQKISAASPPNFTLRDAQPRAPQTSLRFRFALIKTFRVDDR